MRLLYKLDKFSRFKLNEQIKIMLKMVLTKMFLFKLYFRVIVMRKIQVVD